MILKFNLSLVVVVVVVILSAPSTTELIRDLNLPLLVRCCSFCLFFVNKKQKKRKKNNKSRFASDRWREA